MGLHRGALLAHVAESEAACAWQEGRLVVSSAVRAPVDLGTVVVCVPSHEARSMAAFQLQPMQPGGGGAPCWLGAALPCLHCICV